MSKKEHKKNAKLDNDLTDNLADETQKNISIEDVLEEKSADSDNVAEELAQTKDALVRLAAEYDNYRKRTMKEKADLIKGGGEKVLCGLLPVMDDFQRALENIDNAKDLGALKEGVDLIYQKFTNFLAQNGVKPIEDIGEPFDPELHEAVAMIPAQNDDQKGKIIDNVQTGYMLNDKVIRHAKVVVAN